MKWLVPFDQILYGKILRKLQSKLNNFFKTRLYNSAATITQNPGAMELSAQSCAHPIFDHQVKKADTVQPNIGLN